MDGGRWAMQRLRGSRAGWLRRHVLSASLLVPLALVAVAYALLLPRALDSLLIGVAAVGLLALIGLVAALGTERASMVMLVVTFFFAPLTSFSLGPKPLVLASALFVVAFALKLPQLVHRPLRLPAMFLVGSVLFAVMGLIAAPLAISPVTSIIYLGTAIVALIAIPMAVVWMAPTNRQIWAMGIAFGLGSCASTLYGLPGYVYRNYGFTYHPVALAYTCMLTLALVPFLLSMKVRYRWVVVPPIAAIALVGMWTSGSRTGLVVLICLAVMVPVMERSLRMGLVVAGAVVLALPTVFTYEPTSGSTSALSRLLGSGGAQASDQTRLTTIQDGLEQIQASPLFGNGYSVEHTYVIHNLYLQVLAAEGAIGLVGLLLMLAALVIPLRTATAPQRSLCYPAAAAILAGPFQPNMADHYLGLTLGLSLLAAAGVMNRKRVGADPPPAPEEPSGAPTIQARPPDHALGSPSRRTEDS